MFVILHKQVVKMVKRWLIAQNTERNVGFAGCDFSAPNIKVAF